MADGLSTNTRPLRCAIYTRKSSEEGLEQNFNSLHAQRDACSHYIRSQKAEGWIELPKQYDDGGFSGGTLKRPALEELLADVRENRIDVIVFYKLDRLTRSIRDFGELFDELDRHSVSIVSVSESLQTHTANGKLFLNMLLAFAQFEREIAGERIRDKIAASKRRGMWTGGHVPFGYRAVDGKLVTERQEAMLVQQIFDRFLEIGSVTDLIRELEAAGKTNRKGKAFDKSAIYRMLNNRLYVGKVIHKKTEHDGEHKALISNETWTRVQAVLSESPRSRASSSRAETPALLKGLLFDTDGRAMSPTHTTKTTKTGKKRYCYYVSQQDLNHGAGTSSTERVGAGEIETAVIQHVRGLLHQPDFVAETWRHARKTDPDIAETDVLKALIAFDEVWDQLFPKEQAQVIRLIVRQVTIQHDRLDIILWPDMQALWDEIHEDPDFAAWA